MMSYLYYAACLLFFSSCWGHASQQKEKKETVQVVAAPEETKYVNSVQMISPLRNQLYSFGDDVDIRFKCKNNYPADSSVVYVNGYRIATLEKGEDHYIYRFPEAKAGNTVIRVMCYSKQKVGTALVTIRLKPAQAPQKYTYELLRTYSHDPKAYTQGLIYHDGFMYEGTGQYGESSLRKIDMKSGEILSVLNIDRQLFGEGITIYKDKIYQITWRSRKGFVYDLKTFSLESTFQYYSEGWGITTAGNSLIMSDGSHKLYHMSPGSFNIVKEVEVYDHNGEVTQLNELEYIDGLVWANVWLTDRIVAIDPRTGVVKGELDMKNLLSASDKAQLDEKDDVLNGIAWNAEKKTFYLTGKRWPKMFEIKVKN